MGDQNRLRLSAAAGACLALCVASTSSRAASYAFTQPAGPILRTNATLNAMVVPNGLPSVAWFEWGLRGDYGQATSPADVGSTTRVVRVSTPIDGLAEGGVYQFRTVLSNSAGIVYGHPHLFTTGGSCKPAAWRYRANFPAALTNIVAVEGGNFHGLALKSDGTVVAWGDKYAGSETNVPSGLSNVVQISTWGQYCLALRADGKVSAWGVPSQNYGQTNLPVSLTNVISVQGGWLHAIALKSDGSVVAWGNNSDGQRVVPSGMSNVVAITLGNYNSIALKADGTLRVWGSTYYGLEKTSGLSNVVAIAGGAYHCVALRADGTVVTWGLNNYGQTNTPPGLTNVIAIAAGSFFSLALKEDGSVAAWGENASGQTNVPVGLGNVVATAGGDFYALVLAGNVPPQTLGRVTTSSSNSDLLVSVTAYDPNGDLLTYRVVSLPALGMLYQYDSNSRGPAITVAGEAITDPSGRVIFAPGTDEVGFPYATFDIVANDGEADSLPATVTVNVIPCPVLEVSGTSMDTDGAFSLNFVGFTNATYRVWASTNLTNWSLIGTASQADSGLLRLNDTGATNWPQRFYRVTSP